ncbi:MAG: ArsR/SmtB family transcription factor [Planctomycetota bacterium]|jgi:DNA-binding transcriptional ArsR family regulator
MDEKVAGNVAEVLKAVAHPVRLQIVELLAQKEMCVGDIVDALGGNGLPPGWRQSVLSD